MGGNDIIERERGVSIPLHRLGVGVVLVFLSALGFGLMPILALYAYQGGVNVPTLLFLRFSIAAVCFFAFLRHRQIRWHISRRVLISLFLLGTVLYALQSTFYFSAVRYIPASLVALILYLYPVLVALLASRVEKEPLTVGKLGSAILALAGIGVVLGAPVEKADVFGMLLAFGAALVYSVYITLGRQVVIELPAIVTSAFVSAFAAMSFLVFGLANQSLNFAFAATAWAAVMGVVGFSTLLAMAAFFAGIERLGASRASILSTVEPLFTIGFSALLLGESISAIQALGAAMVLAAAIWAIIQGEKKSGT